MDSELGTTKEVGEILPPDEGWKEHTVYLVHVSISEHNPIHVCLFYTGYLYEGEPGGYNCTLNPFGDRKYRITDLHYLKVIKELTELY